jgi:hypothetical protein
MAMRSEFVEPQWARRRGIRTIHVVAVLAALVAVAVVLGMFNQFGASDGDRVQVERRLVASVDLRIGNPAEAFAKGEAEARADIEAGTLKLHTSGPKPADKTDAARARQLKQRYGIVWVHDGEKPTLKASAYAAGYNHVVRAEIEKRHGAEFLDRLLRGEEP